MHPYLLNTVASQRVLVFTPNIILITFDGDVFKTLATSKTIMKVLINILKSREYEEIGFNKKFTSRSLRAIRSMSSVL